jgi:hypothetical protein
LVSSAGSGAGGGPGWFARNWKLIALCLVLFLIGLGVGSANGSSDKAAGGTVTVTGGAPDAETVTETQTETVTEKPATEVGGLKTSFADGTWLVGKDIKPGTYRTQAQSGCYWERDRDLSGGLNSIIANDNGNGQAIVKIASTDAAFVSQDCGTWQRIGA